MKRKALTLALIGFVLGMIVCCVITLIISFASGSGWEFCSDAFVAKIGSKAGAIIIQLLLTGVYGAIAMGTVVLYDLERWPLALASLIHYLIIEVFFEPMALYLEWMHTLPEFLIMIGIRLVCYFIIWLIMYLIYRKQIRDLNKMQEELKDSEEESPK